MPEITIKLTMQQAVPVMMAIANQMDNSRNMRMAVERMAMREEDGSQERLDILDRENKRLAEAYKAIQDAM